MHQPSMIPSDEQDMAVSTPPLPQAPLAERLRPQTLDEFIGQQHLLGEGQVLRNMIVNDSLPSIIFWGPPGTGKTTLARLMSRHTGRHFREFSAVTSSTSDIRQVVEEAKARWSLKQQGTLVFIDEIHRFNKAQQDAFLPHVEAGTFTLIGATTENPSFSVNGALLSRSRVFVLEPLADQDLAQILNHAQSELKEQLPGLVPQVQRALIQFADGDARRLLTAIETLVASNPDSEITVESLKNTLQHKHILYDKTGEQHYNLISAMHKSLRDSDPDATVYWLARMLEAGEDPLFLCRRLTRAAAEDIGLADPQALQLAAATFEAVKNIGMPESNVILTELAIYLALAPKSNALYRAYSSARADVESTANDPVPLHLRNAPTKLMKSLDYGKGYKYAHDFQDAKVDQQHLPDKLKRKKYFHPQRGWENEKLQ